MILLLRDPGPSPGCAVVGREGSSKTPVSLLPVKSVASEASRRSPDVAVSTLCGDESDGRGKRERWAAVEVSTKPSPLLLPSEPDTSRATLFGGAVPSLISLEGVRWVVRSLLALLILRSTRALSRSSERTTKNVLKAG